VKKIEQSNGGRIIIIEHRKDISYSLISSLLEILVLVLDDFDLFGGTLRLNFIAVPCNYCASLYVNEMIKSMALLHKMYISLAPLFVKNRLALRLLSV